MESGPRSWGRVWASGQGVQIFLMAIGFGASAFALAFFAGIKNLDFVEVWTLGAVGALGATIGVVRSKSLEAAIGWSVVLAVASVVWWTSALLVVDTSAIVIPIGTSFLAIVLLTLPWNSRAWVVVAGVLVILWSIARGPIPVVLWWAWGVVLFTSSIRPAALGFTRFLIERAHVAIRAVVEEQSDQRALAVGVIRAMMEGVNAGTVLYVPPKGKCALISGTHEYLSVADEIFHRELSESRFARGESNELIPSRLLGADFQPALLQWFGQIPPMVWIGVFEGLGEGRGGRALVMIPCARWTGFAGRDRIARALAGLAASIRVHLRAGHTRQVSSDVVVEAQRAASEREQELNEVIHIANNVAQDISIAVEDGADLFPDHAASGEVATLLGRIRRGVYRLSTGASDVKWLKEIRKITAARRKEPVLVSSLIEEIRRYIDALGRGGAGIQVIWEGNLDTFFTVLSREYLESSVRFYIASRLRALRIAGHDSDDFVLRIIVDPIEVHFRFSDSGAAAVTDSEVLPLMKCAQLSGGKGSMVHDAATSFVVITLPRSEGPKPLSSPSGERWVLLVDDKVDVVTFYSRIADALELPYVTAESVAAARRIIDARGAPSLLITDIHLGNESGLDLVALFREKFSNEIPIIVVSGEVSDEIQRRAKSLGVTRFLPKPVSRGKLFSEIRALVGLAGES